MVKSAMVRTMHTRRTIDANSATNRSKSFSTATATPWTRTGRRIRPPPRIHRFFKTDSSEVFLRFEDEGDRLFDTESLGFLLDHRRHRFDERRLVRRNDLRELCLQLLQILQFRDFPCTTHIGLSARSGFEDSL